MKDLWVPLSGAIAQQRNVETIANNVANANTPGFKKDQLAFREHLSNAKANEDINLPNKVWAPEDFYHHQGAENSMVKVNNSYTNFQQGQVVSTGNGLDLAISGKAFFEVLTPSGIKFTRKGIFSLAKDGTLVTDQGNPILISRDEATNIDSPQDRIVRIEGQAVQINQKGEIFSNKKNLGRLSLIEFKNQSLLKKEGNSLYINNDTNNELEQHSSRILQGFIEQSNVNAVEEMAKLIKANRHFESIQRVIKTYDNISQKSVNDLLRF